MDHVLCSTKREALCRRLGLAAKKKLPLLQRDVDAIITRQLGNDHTLQVRGLHGEHIPGCRLDQSED